MSISHGMCGFNGRDDSFGFREILEGTDGFLICYRHIFSAAGVMEPGVLRTDARVIQSWEIE